MKARNRFDAAAGDLVSIALIVALSFVIIGIGRFLGIAP